MQQLPSQLQQMQDSEESQEVESNHCGRLSHVSSKPVMIPSSRALFSLDQRLIHPEITLEEFNLTTCIETEEQSLEQEGRRLVTPMKTDKIKAQVQCLHLQQNR